jgi:hypothetical protein
MFLLIIKRILGLSSYQVVHCMKELQSTQVDPSLSWK